MEQSDAKAHRRNEQLSPLNRVDTLAFQYRGHWARNSIHLRPLANEAESSQNQNLAANHPGDNQSAQRNRAAWDGYESSHHGQKKQDSKMRANDQAGDQRHGILAERAHHENQMDNQRPVQTYLESIHKGQQTVHSERDLFSQA